MTTNNLRDKYIERDRYDHKAQSLRLYRKPFSQNQSMDFGSKDIASYLRTPYEEFENAISKIAHSDMSILEIGSGTGAHTGVLISTGALVTASDISQISLEVLKEKYSTALNLTIKVVDMEKIPFENSSFDLITSVGSLSYGDNDLVLTEVYRVLKPNGYFVCVDSLNHNFIYRINRYIQYMRGMRTHSTLLRMPTIGLLNKYESKFSSVKFSFFGAISWAAPFLSKIFSENSVCKASNLLDNFFRIRRAAFKCLIIAQK